MEKKVVKSLEEQIVIQKKKLEVLEQKAIKQKRDTILNFFKAFLFIFAPPPAAPDWPKPPWPAK